MGQTVAHPVEGVLRDAADRRSTGCLVLTGPDDGQARVWLRDGQVYAVTVPGHRPKVGVRLLSSGVISPEQLAEALEVQRRELPDWRLGELLVHLGFVPRDVVDAFVAEQVRDQVADLLDWEVTASRLNEGEETRNDVAPPVPVDDLLADAQDRVARWGRLTEVIGGAHTVPVLATRDTGPADVVLGPHDWALLAKVDGRRDVSALARECGFTLAETGQLLQALLGAGLVVLSGSGVPTSDGPWGSASPPDPSWVGSDLDPGQVRAGVATALTALGELLRAPAPLPRPEPALPGPPVPEPRPEPLPEPTVVVAPGVEPSVAAEPPGAPEPAPVAVEPSIVVEEQPVRIPEPAAVAAASPRDAAMLLTELVNEAAEQPSRPAPATAPTAATPAPVAEPAAATPAPPPTAPADATPREHLDPADAAALLRELSSLGGDEPKPAAPAAPRPAAPAPSEHKKKKRGFFGH